MIRESLKCYVLKNNDWYIRKKPFGGYKRVKHFSASCIFLAYEDPQAIAEYIQISQGFQIKVHEFSLVKEEVFYT